MAKCFRCRGPGPEPDQAVCANQVKPRLQILGVAVLAGVLLPATGAQPIVLQRFSLPGPVAGVVARVDLRDPRISVQVAMAEGGEPRGAQSDCVGRLDVPSAIARRQDFAVAVNASYFSAAAKEVGGAKVHFFVGNCGTPVGWQASEGRIRTRPSQPHIQATLVGHASGQLTLHPRLDELPAGARFAVGGSALVLERGRVIAESRSEIRHPRTAVGVSEDGGTLMLVVVDGRQEGHSRGATLAELGNLLKGFGAHHAINLDGGGSTAMVARDPATGVFAVLNRPSDPAAGLPGSRVERPVVDVLGVRLLDPRP